MSAFCRYAVGGQTCGKHPGPEVAICLLLQTTLVVEIIAPQLDRAKFAQFILR